jgi:hypothetical protein
MSGPAAEGSPWQARAGSPLVSPPDLVTVTAEQPTGSAVDRVPQPHRPAGAAGCDERPAGGRYPAYSVLGADVTGQDPHQRPSTPSHSHTIPSVPPEAIRVRCARDDTAR